MTDLEKLAYILLATFILTVLTWAILDNRKDICRYHYPECVIGADR